MLVNHTVVCKDVVLKFFNLFIPRGPNPALSLILTPATSTSNESAVPREGT